MELSARFSTNTFDYTQDNKAHMVLSVTAPQIDWIKQRPKICVLPLIDVSGSMAGDKIEYAKQSVKKLIEQLAPGDFAGILLFESNVHTLVTPEEVTPEFKTKLLQEVGKIHPRGGTNFSDGISKALELVHNLDLPPSYLPRVIAFTDGEPTQGITDKAVIKKLLDSQRGNVTVSFFGYGNESANTRLSFMSGCDQDFLTELSTVGKGNYAYVQNPDDSLAAFGKELGGLLSTYASDLRMVIEPRGEHSIAKVVTDVPVDDDVVGELALDLSDILSEETRHVVIECDLQKQKNTIPREVGLFDVTVYYSHITESGEKESGTLKATAKARFVKASDVVEPDKELDKIVSLHDMIRTQMEAEELAKQGHYDAAQEALRVRADMYTAKGYDGIAAAAANASELFLDANSVQTNSGYLNTMRRGVMRSASLSLGDRAGSAMVSNLVGALGNSAQEAYTTSFTSDSGTPAAAAEWKVDLSTTTGSAAVPAAPTPPPSKGE